MLVRLLRLQLCSTSLDGTALNPTQGVLQLTTQHYTSRVSATHKQTVACKQL
jgi:hypothetical protein